MAATVLSGKGNVSYTNNTGQNVRIVINFLRKEGSSAATITVSNSGGDDLVMSLVGDGVIGRSLAYFDSYTGAATQISNNAGGSSSGSFTVPTEIAMGSGETFSVTASNGDIHYNLLVIPEAG